LQLLFNYVLNKQPFFCCCCSYYIQSLQLRHMRGPYIVSVEHIFMYVYVC
jgi:hypothetical protein